MRLIISILFLFSFITIHSQDLKKVDSLIQSLNRDISATGKVDIYNQIAESYRTSDTTQALHYIQLAKTLSDSIDYPQGKVDAQCNLGWIKITGSAYEEAEILFTQALNLAKSNELQKGMAISYQNIGVSYWYRGRYSSALDSYLDALRVWEEMDDPTGMAAVRMNVGIIHWNLGDNIKARENISEAIEIYKMLGNKEGLAKGYTNIGVTYEEEGDLGEALKYYLKSQKMLVEIGDKRVLAYNYTNVGIIYDLQESYDSAHWYYYKAIALFDEIGSHAEKAQPLIDLGKSFYHQNQFSKARKYLTEGIELAKNANFLSSVQDGTEYLAKVEAALGNHKGAYAAHVLFKQVSDSLISDQQNEEIVKLEADYEFEKERDSIAFVQEKDRLAFEAEIIRQGTNQKITMAGLIILALFLVGFILFTRKLKRLNAEVSAQRDNLTLLNSAKSRFFSIISHDLRGPIGAINGFSELITKYVHKEYGRQSDDLEKMTSALNLSSSRVVTLLDDLMKWALKEEGLMPFEPEPLSINECIDNTIELLRPQAESKGVDLYSELPAELVATLDKNRMMTVFRNLLSNSIKFTNEGGRVYVTGNKNAETLEVAIHDTGVGIPQEKIDRLYVIDETKSSTGTRGEVGTGLGLNLVHDFVKKNKGDIAVESTLGKGTMFTLSFPVS